MIQIHRRQPVVRMGERVVRLTRIEHELITVLGMLDNRLTSQRLLLDLMCENQALQVQADKQVLLNRIARLRKKIGTRRLRCKHGRGYILEGNVQFYG